MWGLEGVLLLLESKDILELLNGIRSLYWSFKVWNLMLGCWILWGIWYQNTYYKAVAGEI